MWVLPKLKQLHSLPCKSKGLTLIELIAVVAIAAIVLGIAVPSFQDLIRSNALATNSQQLISSVQLAKSEAISRNLPVVMCVRNGQQCAADTAGIGWESGWLIFVDENYDNDLNNGEEIIQLNDPLDNGQTLRTTVNSFTFQSNGRLQNAPLAMNLCAPNADPTDFKSARNLSFNGFGRIDISGSPTCPSQN